MTIFASKQKQRRKESAARPDAKEFMANAREEHLQLLSHYAERAEQDYDDVTQLISDIETDAWNLTERVVKASYANGIKKGRASRRQP